MMLGFTERRLSSLVFRHPALSRFAIKDTFMGLIKDHQMALGFVLADAFWDLAVAQRHLAFTPEDSHLILDTAI